MNNELRMRVMGVDPGFDRCGVAILEEDKLLFSTCIVTDRKSPQEERLLQIGSEIGRIIKKWEPNSLATEKLFFNMNVKTALKVAEARGVILSEASKAGLDVSEYSPQAIKIAVTGYGKATKPQVEAMTMRLLKLKSIPKYDDEMDAIALGITHIASSRGIWYK